MVGVGSGQEQGLEDFRMVGVGSGQESGIVDLVGVIFFGAGACRPQHDSSRNLAEGQGL